MALVGVVAKTFYYMVAQFGALGWAELIVAKRMDDWNGDDLLQIPFYVRQMGSYTSIVAYLTVWLLVIMSISEKKKNRRILRILLIVHLMFTFCRWDVEWLKSSNFRHNNVVCCFFFLCILC